MSFYLKSNNDIKKLVSIIVPCYNYGNFLSEALQSVLNQSYSHWECLIIDDGSTDNTKEISTNYTSIDPRFRYFYQKNQGVSSARNFGIKQSVGDFIQFLDGDDLLEYNKLQSQINSFKINPQADIIYNNFRYFDDGILNNQRTSLLGDRADDWVPKFSTKGKEIIDFINRTNFLVVHSPLIKKEIFKSVGVFNELMKGLEDRDFWTRCAVANSFFHFNEQNNDYALVRVHLGSLSNQKRIMDEGYFLFLKSAIENKKYNYSSRLLFVLKYIELFWESIINQKYFKNQFTFLTVISFFLFPLYLCIKIYRIFKKNKT